MELKVYYITSGMLLAYNHCFKKNPYTLL